MAPATENIALKAADPIVETNGEDLTAMSEAIARQAEVLAQADEKIATLEAENLALKELNGGLGKTIEELNAALADKDSEIAQKGGRPIHKHGKDSYEQRLPKFTYRFKGKPMEVTEEVIRGNKELLEELVKIEDGPLVKKGGK